MSGKPKLLKQLSGSNQGSGDRQALVLEIAHDVEKINGIGSERPERIQVGRKNGPWVKIGGEEGVSP